jgi:hypothetical protein
MTFLVVTKPKQKVTTTLLQQKKKIRRQQPFHCNKTKTKGDSSFVAIAFFAAAKPRKAKEEGCLFHSNIIEKRRA